ncbi:MAG: chemotaxis response regulator protein-glutamate methylesterase [Candidatus Zixiibacteriota bacterium]|nr:MAG: chemotaxis response regulator protein-glutamate methylesterase [candidate division Zixibacteria bacterium]
MRKAITMMLESDPQIKVVGSASNGEEGIARVKQLKPDLVTMDVEMPRMDGLTALRQIMATNPVPVMMVSSITTDGAKATLAALELGAVDFIPKQMSYVSLDIVKIKEELVAKIKNIVSRKHILMARFRTRSSFSAAGKDSGQPSKPAPPVRTPTRSVIKAKRHHKINIIALGSSTGGPPALQAVIPKLPRNLPVGMLIAQHMPEMFTKSLAERLDGLSQVTVREASDGDAVEPGLVLIAPGGKHMTLRKYGGKARVAVSDKPTDTLYHPCVDVMMNSVAEAYGGSTMGVVLTGMGSNGLEGSRNIKNKGGILIAQDEASCIVYGMPRAIVDAKIADHVTSIDQVASEITSYF